MVKNLPVNARVMGLIPGWGTKIPRAEEQLSPCTTTHKQQLRKPMRLEPVSETREAMAVRSLSTAMKSSPGLLQVEKACMQQ